MTKFRYGWRNNYRRDTSIPEVIGKDIRHALNDLVLWVKNGFQLPEIVVFPDFPSKKTTLFKIARKLGYRLTNKPLSNPDLVIYFEDITSGNTSELKRKYPHYCLNEACTDISKTVVDAVHRSVFGYNTFIDPLTFRGKAVSKSDINALHDGKIIDCPLSEKQEGSIYQILLDNAFDDKFVVDFRVPVIGREIPLVYKKFKSYPERFTNNVDHSTLHRPEEVFNASELSTIVEFAQAMKADFCELDIIRHSDGRIFIIDVNKTPYGPPFGLQEKDLAVLLLSKAFQHQFLTS